MKKLRVLVPLYFKDFECIGTKCEDTCCKGWNISIDKQTYKKYKQIKNDIDLGKNIIFNKNKENKYEYALIKKDDNGFCPFLDEKLLCSVYLKFGEDYMPFTCKVYPRYVNKVNEIPEISLTLSCPEAVRKALLPNNKMEFEYMYMEYKDYIKVYNYAIYDEVEEYKYFWNVRTESISILQERNYDIVTRLMLLGMMSKRIENCIESKKFLDIPNNIYSFMNMVKNNFNSNILENIEKNIVIQISIYKNIIKKLNINKSAKLREYFDCIDNIFKIDDNNANDLYINEKSIYKYKSILDNEFSDFINGEGIYVIENYLVNEYFRNVMPFGKFDTIWESLIVLCSNYCILKILIIGCIAKKGSINTDDIVEIVYLMTRELVHLTNYYKYIIQNIKKLELDTLGGLYIMIA